jgi:hypothetical protein
VTKLINLTPLVNAFIVLLGAVITAFLVPYIKRKLNEAQLIELAKWVEIAVKAAEQIIRGTKVGKERKEWVLAYLRDRGFDLDDEEVAAQVDALIEAFVLGLRQNANT